MFPRILLVWIISTNLLTPSTARADGDAQSSARAALERAVKALGGEEKLGALESLFVKAKIVAMLGEREFPVTLAGALQGHDRMHFTLEGFRDGGRGGAVFVYNDDKIWRQIGAEVKELKEDSKENAAFFSHEAYALRLAQRPTVLKDKAFELASVGEEKIGDKAAVGVRVSRKGRPDVNLYFDKQTGLPIKCELRSKGFAGQFNLFQEKTFGLYLGEYKELDGVKHFTRVVFKADDQRVMELEFTEFATREGFEASTFGQPK